MRLLLVCVFCMAACEPAMAGLSGSDDFNDNAMDPLKWSVFMGDLLSETNSRLEYAGGSGEVLGVWKWEKNSGSYIQDWSISLDVVNAVEESGLADQDVNYGFLVWNTSPNDNLFSVEFKVGDDAGGTHPFRYIETAAEKNNVNVLDHQTPLSADAARLQISFDASAKVFSGSYDTGSGWALLTSINIAGWGLTDSDTFTAAVYSSSRNVTPGSGEVFGDNFAAIPEPGALGLIMLSGGGLLFARHIQDRRKSRSWPTE